MWNYNGDITVYDLKVLISQALFTYGALVLVLVEHKYTEQQGRSASIASLLLPTNTGQNSEVIFDNVLNAVILFTLGILLRSHISGWYKPSFPVRGLGRDIIE